MASTSKMASVTTRMAPVSTRVASAPFKSTPAQRATFPVSRRGQVAVRSSEEDADAELEKRLEKLRLAKGATPYGESKKAQPARSAPAPESKGKAAAAAKPVYDFTGETVFYEGAPSRGDLAVNVALGTTLVWLPLTIAAVGRAAFLSYKFTDKRLSIVSNAPWQKEQTDVAYQEVKEVVTIGRGIGLWGDMVVTLKDGSRVEIRSLDRFKEIRDYILARRDALAPQAGMVTAEELMGETPAGKGKGFA